MALPRLISDGMVLQRNTKVALWGEAQPHQIVKVTFLGKEYASTADSRGEWKIEMDNLEPGGPYEMTIEADTVTVLKDILVGDVWVLGGQSNMELPVRRTLDLFRDEIQDAHYPRIRQFTVPQTYNFHGPQRDLAGGNWITATGEDIYSFSAVGYFCARELYEKTGVPIGLIATAQGGTPVEAWTSEQTLRRIGGYDDELDRIKDDSFIAETKAKEEEQGKQWYGELYERDLGLRERWFKDEMDASGWAEFEVPNSWRGTELESVRGAVWFRREFDVPSSMAGAAAQLKLGTLIDADDTYINGEHVGSTGYRYPPRRYTVPAGLLRAGKNTIAVRVISTGSVGEFALDMPYELIAGGQKVRLDGVWKYRTGVVMTESPKPSTFFQYKPAGLYNGMIAPLKNYRIKGALWYQGESNTGRPAGYRDLFREMVQDWRNQWGIGEFPYIYVQLANFDHERHGGTNWAELREEQRQCLAIPNTAMAVAIDLGQYNELHPQDKKTLGQRLALCARKLAYGEELVYSGPMVREARIAEDGVRLTFDHVGSGLVARGGELRGFEVCGDDSKFVTAKAEIVGDTVVVTHDQVKVPRHIRYAWANDPTDVSPGANLYNAEGLPASPFTIEAGDR